ncbi:MAG TPA: FAD-dependent oxidoreductase [Burkholderiales bacterium]|nr:FAD-dependent oxidoreductase [Burkholderiales bacterium]
MSRHDVIVVGAGPVGLACALKLSRAGIDTLLIEAEPQLNEELRASTFHPPTLDMLEEFGITAALIRQGLITPTWQVRMHPGGERAEFDLSLLKDHTRHPYRVQCEQWKLSRLLVTQLAGELWFETRATAVSQTPAAVTLMAERGGEPLELECQYLVGADGARSAVRKSLALDFEGLTFPETTILATTRFDFAAHMEGLSGVNYCWAPTGTFSLLRLPGEWRVSLYPDDGESVEAALEPDAIERKMQRIVPRSERYEVLQTRPYRIHQRVVDRYRVGRVLLAGDAAHLNSPSGGMGMNGGIHDAFSLADKLARVLRGGDPSLLDLYGRQRRPVALEQILAQSGRNRARMQERDPEKRRAALRELQAIAADPERALKHLLRTSMIEGLRQAQALAA